MGNMKTVQEWLRDLDTVELVDAYFREHPMDFNHLEEEAKKMRVCDLQKKGREKLRGYINYLRTLPVKSDEEDDEIEWEVKHNRKPDPIEQDSPEEERLRIKAEKAVTAYFEESRRHELKQLINQFS